MRETTNYHSPDRNMPLTIAEEIKRFQHTYILPETGKINTFLSSLQTCHLPAERLKHIDIYGLVSGRPHLYVSST